MRLKSIKAYDIGPIKRFEVDNLGEIVIIAGANGSGKTQLKDEIRKQIPSAGNHNLKLEIEGTTAAERNYFGDSIILDGALRNRRYDPVILDDPDGMAILQNQRKFIDYLSLRIKGGYKGSVVNIDSNRTITKINFPVFSLDVNDPEEEDFDIKYYLNDSSSRWNNVIQKIYQSVASRQQKIGKFILKGESPSLSQEQILKKFPDKFLEFKEAFTRLLPNKELVDIVNPASPQEFQYRIIGVDHENVTRLFSSLSSGEQEVVKICFDFLLKEISHCIIIVDEPELHLHPSLTFKLIETLKSIGKNNQFIFFTHSADLISTYYSTGNVFFINNQEENINQACRLKDINDAQSSISNYISKDLGVFAVSKNIVFVEGKDSSIDKLTYYKVAETIFVNCVISPIGSVLNLNTLNEICAELNKAVFGINFFLIRDRDGLKDTDIAELTKVSNGRFSSLQRKHIENYYLNAEILAKAAKRLYLDKLLQNPQYLREKLKEIAIKHKNLAIIEEIKANLTLKGNLGLKAPKNIHNKSLDELIEDFNKCCENEIARISTLLDNETISKNIKALDEKYKLALNSDREEAWLKELPGKNIFKDFCGQIFKCDAEKVRQAYLDEVIELRLKQIEKSDSQESEYDLTSKSSKLENPMDDLFKIFENFNKIANNT